jgi:hypothetical protein
LSYCNSFVIIDTADEFQHNLKGNKDEIFQSRNKNLQVV